MTCFSSHIKTREIERALSSTLTVAEFVKHGQAAQQAVDAIFSADRSKRKS